MLRRPSARRKSRSQEEIELPLVPVMDAFVTLIAFLLMATSLLSVTLIDTPVPIVSNMPDDNKEKPLNLTVTIEEENLKLSSQFDLIPAQVFPKTDKNYDIDKFHLALIDIKKKFPKDRKVIFMPSAGVKYNDIVQIMDASRNVFKTDPPLYSEGEGGISKVEKDLFPEAVFGNIVSGI